MNDTEWFVQPVMVEIDGALSYIHVTVWEPAKPKKVIYLIHDLAGRSDDFLALAPLLAALGYRVVAFDMPGRGRSAWLSPGQYLSETYVRVSLAVMQEFWLPDASLLGQGWGAMIALLVERVGRVKLKNLVFLDLPKHWSHQTDRSIDLWEKIVAISARDEQGYLSQISACVPQPMKGRQHLIALVGQRVRCVEQEYRVSVDPQVFLDLRKFADEPYDLEPLLGVVKASLWLVQGLHSVPPYGAYSPHMQKEKTVRRIRVLRATNIPWGSDDILAPVVGLFSQISAESEAQA